MIKPGVTVVTPTGDRPYPFSLCCEYMQRQTMRPHQWIIMDDGNETMDLLNERFHALQQLQKITNVQHISRKRGKKEKGHSLRHQIVAALRYVEHEYVIFVEDDDWYHPRYLEEMLMMGSGKGEPLLFGQGVGAYYHIPTRSHYHYSNRDRASLCQTGFHFSIRDLVQDACLDSMTPFVDMRLWRRVRSKFLSFEKPLLCVGMKGLPGRPGTTMGWKRPDVFDADPNCYELMKLITREDVERYKQWL